MKNRHLEPPIDSTQQTRRASPPLEAWWISLPDAIMIWDRAGMIFFLNVPACRLFEISASDAVVGTSIQTFFQRYAWSDDQHQEFVFAPWLLDPATHRNEAPSFPYEHALVLGLPSTRTVPLELRCIPVLDAQEQPAGMLAIFQEMAPHYQKALHIQRVYEALMALNEAITHLPEQMHVAALDDPPLFSPPVTLVNQQLVDVIHQVVACWGVKLFAFRSPNLALLYVVGSGFTPEEQHWFQEVSGRFRFADLFSETVLAHLKANQAVILSPDHIRLPAGYPTAFRAASILALPLFWEQHLMGMLLIYKHESEGGYSQEEIDLVGAVAAQALLLIECISYLQTYSGKQTREQVLPEADQLSKDFLTLASHELRTPLTQIKGNLQLAQRRLARLKQDLEQQTARTSERLEQTQQSLEAAEQSVRLQERMVQAMIDDARIQAGQLDLLLSPCDLLALVKQTVAQQQVSVPERAIKLEVLLSKPTIPVLADAGRIIQVLTIYVATALAYSPAEKPVTVQVQEEKQMARVSVHDEGPGMPPEEQGRLWDRFYRGKGSSVQQELDLSLGLSFYLCRALIERHHGSVGVESEPGHGTTFWFALPIGDGPFQ